MYNYPVRRSEFTDKHRINLTFLFFIKNKNEQQWRVTYLHQTKPSKILRPGQLTWRPPVTGSPGHPAYPPLVTRSTGRRTHIFPQQLGRYLIVWNTSPRNNLGHYSSRQPRPALSYIIQNLPLNSTLSLLSLNKRRIFRIFIQLPNSCCNHSIYWTNAIIDLVPSNVV